MTPNEKVLVRATALHLAHWTGPVLVHWENEEWERCICGQEDGKPVIWSDAFGMWMDAGDDGTSTVYLDLGFPECFDRVVRVLALKHGLDAEKGCIWQKTGLHAWRLRVAPAVNLQAGVPSLDSYERRFTVPLDREVKSLFANRKGCENLFVEVAELKQAKTDMQALALCVGCEVDP